MSVAHRYYEAYEYDSAIAVLKGFTPSSKQERIEVYNFLGKCYLRRARVTEAYNSYDSAFRLSEGMEVTHRGNHMQALLGKIYCGQLSSKFRGDIANIYTILNIYKNEPLYTEELVNTYLALGTQYRYSYQQDSARKYFQLASSLADESHRALPVVFSEWAMSFIADNNYDSGHLSLDKAKYLALKQHPEDPLYVVMINLTQAKLYILQNMINEAKSLLVEETLPIVETKLDKNHIYYGLFHEYLSAIYADIADHQLAIKYALSAAVNYNSNKNAFLTAHIYTVIGNEYVVNNEPSQAIEYLQKSINVLENLDPHHKQLPVCHRMLATAYERRGDYDVALRLYNLAEELYKSHNLDNGSKGSLYFYRARLFDSMKLYTTAIDDYKSALKYLSKTIGNNSVKEAYLLSHISRSCLALEQSDSARYYLERAKQRITNTSSQNDVKLFTDWLQAKYYLQIGNKEAAESIIQKGIQEIYLGQGMLLDDELPPISLISDNVLLTEFLHLKVKLLESLITDKNAVSMLNRILRIYNYIINVEINNNRGRLMQSDKLEEQGDIAPIYQRAISVAFRLYTLTNNKTYIDEAFKLSEKYRSGILTEASGKHTAWSQANIPDSIRERDDRIRNEISYYQTQITGSNQRLEFDGNFIDQYQELLFEAKRRHEELISQLEADYPEYYDLKYSTEGLSIDETQKYLLPGQLLLTYFTEGKHTYAVYCTKYTMGSKRLDFDPNLVGALRSSLNEGEDAYLKYYKQFCRSSHELYKQLLQPILNDVHENIDRITIIPDGQLAYIPFEVLLTSPGDSTLYDYKSLDYLLKKYTVNYTYSANTLKTKAFASNNDDLKIKALAPEYHPAKRYKVRGASTDSSVNYVSLKWNKEEVKLLKSMYEGEFLDAKQATEQAFKHEISNFDIIHLAGHADVSPYSSDYSNIIFTHEEDSLEDGRLFNFELYNMHIPASMVVLNGCHTGFGELESGEGVMSLARAFLYAGCQSIVTTHWSYDDKTSFELMRFYYEFLSEGMHKDDALRVAKLKFIEDASAERAYPYYWGGTVIIGDSRPIFKDAINYWLWILVVGLALAGLAYGKVKRVRQ